MSDRIIFRNLVSVDEAREKFLKHAPTNILQSEKVELITSIGRVIAQDVFSPLDVPPFDRAAMDGFAVKASDTSDSKEDHSIELEVVGSIKAGYIFEGMILGGSCVEISTGAPIPPGADSVVMVEFTNRIKNNVEIFRATTPGENIMSAGTDIQKGERIISAFTILTSRELAVLAAMGYKEIEVIRKPKVGIFSSGDEITELGEELQEGKLYDINSTAIAASILEHGGDPDLLGIIDDDLDHLHAKLSGSMKKYDLLIISGGTSAGMGDMLYTVIDRLGSPGLLVHGVKVKPGKPTILAVCDSIPIIGLPGYPASALSINKLFVIPYMRYLAGLPPISQSDKIKATIKQRIRSVFGRHEFKPMNLIQSPDGLLAFPVPGGSGAITSIALADGFVEIPEDISFLSPDSEVEISLLSKNIRPYDIQIIGSHCIALSRLQKFFSTVYPQYQSRSIVVGSSGGVGAIRRGEAHIAGVHLLDSEKGYNTWLLENLDANLISGYYRMQGFIVQKGNPKQIYSLKDLTRPEVQFMNRNPGSGTRVLFDRLLEKSSINKREINGYDQFCRSHTSAAVAVKSGIVDVVIGIENAVTEDLDFVELREEEYDFLVSNKYIKLPAVQSFVSLIRSPEFKQIIEKLKGYRPK